MRSLCAFAVFAAVLVVVIAAAVPAQEISDPYEILNRYFQTAGGLERLLAERTSYSEGTLSLGGMEGSLKVWMQKPGQNRIEVALGPLNIIQGDNGEHAWVLDQNGKLQVITNPDDATVKRRQVRRLIEEYAFAQPGSDIFKVSLEGIDQVEGKNCYVIKITNKINVDSYTYYINAQTFVQEKTAFAEDIESRDVFYGDYREIEGLLVPFWTNEVPRQTGQAQEIRITRYVSNLKIELSLFEPPKQDTKDYQFANGNRAENIPFEFIGNHLYIPVTVSEKERLWVLDTGAGMTVLNKTFAEELGLELEGELKGKGAGGTVTASLTTIPPYSVKGIQFKEQKVAVIDMSELIRRLGLDVVGVLGFDFLSRFVTKVDFAKELVSFYEPEKFEYTGEGHVLGMHIYNSLFSVKATLDGNHAGSWTFDLGAGTSFLDGRYALREGYTRKDGIMHLAHGAGNEFQVKDIRCDSMQFAGFTVYQPEISFAYGGTDSNFTADQIGVLGNSLFRNFVLYCNYAGERLFVEPGDKFNQPWPADHSGLQIAWSQDQEVEVSYVSPDTPAEKAGFVKGDLLRSINGINVGLFDGVIAIRKLLQANPGTTYEFVVDRAGENKKLKLRLARLL
ncbi:MAG: aspartyl protease family protein [Candidatus Zixiibacteriota bacterium]